MKWPWSHECVFEPPPLIVGNRPLRRFEANPACAACGHKKVEFKYQNLEHETQNSFDLATYGKVVILFVICKTCGCREGMRPKFVKRVATIEPQEIATSDSHEQTEQLGSGPIPSELVAEIKS